MYFANFVTTDMCLDNFWKNYSKMYLICNSLCKNLSCRNHREVSVQIMVYIHMLDLIFLPCMLCFLFLAEFLTMNA